MERVKPKSLLKSKTFYFGLLMVLVAIANMFGFADFQPSNTLVGLVGVVTIVLRLFTKAPIK
jgi:hypothetical protein